MTRYSENPDLDSLPQFAKPLAPYIKTRQEALKIRRVLTLYLRSQISFPEDITASHLSLTTPHHVRGVKRVPQEVTGLRREYLKALQVNIAARKEYDSLTEGFTSNKDGKQASTVDQKEEAEQFRTYLALLNDRKRHETLRVFHQALAKFDKTEAAQPSYLNITGSGKSHAVALGFDTDTSPEAWSGETQKHGNDLEEIVHNLERAVVRAKHQLDKEKKLLEQLKAQKADIQDPVSPLAKLQALSLTRDELVRWVEDKLATPGAGDHLANPSLEEIDGSSQALETQKAEIGVRYAAYVEARKRLLNAATSATQPLPLDTARKAAEVQPTKNLHQSNGPQPISVVPFASDVLVPLSKRQKALALEKSYFAAILGKEKDTTRRILDRLSDESHLLPEYPILARQPRFKHAVAAITPRAGDSSDPQKTDEIVRQAQAWAFAAEAARNATRDVIEEKVTYGLEVAEGAEETLKEVYEMMNQDHEEAVRGEAPAEEDDIWAAGARTTRGRVRQGRAEKRPKGPWSGLNGKVGVTNDG